MKSRFYDPAIGRFLQPDTIVPDPANPQSLNRYSYVLNNPMRYTDPTGHAGVCGQNAVVIECFSFSSGPWTQAKAPPSDSSCGQDYYCHLIYQEDLREWGDYFAPDACWSCALVAVDIAIGFHPIAGTACDIVGVAIERTCTGQSVGRWPSLIAFALPIGGSRFLGGWLDNVGDAKRAANATSRASGSLDDVLGSTNRVFRGKLEEMESLASTNPGWRRSLGETQRIFDEATKRGWKPRGGIDDSWRGGLHVNLAGPSGETVHFPVAEGFRLP